MLYRIGTFLMFVGAILIGLFILSDFAKTPMLNYLLCGGSIFMLGIFLWFKNPLPKAPPSGRFRIMKKAEKKQEKKL
jgi:hypothetical protein